MNKWFKIAGVVGVAVLVASLVAGVAWAQGPADEDGDGRCDVCGEELGDGLFGRWRDRLEDIMPWRGRGPGADDDVPCEEYVDEDGDGVCDLHEERFDGDVMPRWRGDPDAAPQWQGRGPGADGDMPRDEFVDEDGDGLCDEHREQLGERPFAGRMRPGTSGRGRMGR
jgi:hypothetical protein